MEEYLVYKGTKKCSVPWMDSYFGKLSTIRISKKEKKKERTSWIDLAYVRIFFFISNKII